MAKNTRKRRARRHRARRKIAENELKISRMVMGVWQSDLTDVHKDWLIQQYRSRIAHQQRILEQNS